MKVVELKGFFVTGILVSARWQELWIEMPAAWQRFCLRYREIGQRESKTLLDISLNQQGEIYTQLLCARVAGEIAAPDGMVCREIPPARYIHTRHEGALEEIAATFGEMYSWAKTNKLAAGNFKLDIGYMPDGSIAPHDLYVRLEGDTTES